MSKVPSTAIQSVMQGLTPAREQVYALAQVMMECQAGQGVQVWCQEFQGGEERKRLSLLFVMNEVMVKTALTTDMQFLQAFAEVMEEVVETLKRDKQDRLLEELRKMSLVWEDTRIFSQQFSRHLKTLILQALNTVLDENSEAHLVQTFPLTRLLREIEQAGEGIEPIGQKVKDVDQFLSLTRKRPEKLREMKGNLGKYREQCIRNLAAHVTAITLLPLRFAD